ncbi:hypothetical protein PFICI_03638 [Pestalotiopsis fici W106-1]|uniref:Carboxypeptidase Y n=1 Tax=Pestalotiopsis fici (strain W106-1 / CGMCC3.15140) TaxID=1229662 RepID=W3XHQ5_PESFW|nr:uncharacterized protein PFICI_03638 [Pestalotiopsis fici W106-1]ETS85613.1 hypothetical protein PFICI_03638 [Pestalotiopsis fici W106-1]
MALHNAILVVLFGWLSIVRAIPEWPAQWRLAADDTPLRGSRPRSTKIRQTEDICQAGSPQWSGTVPVGENRDMFFWYFESRSEPQKAPLVIWLNGGPGASSLLGAFHEIGPCSVSDDGKSTTKNHNSWTNFANMLFIDQPIGAGYSETADPVLWSEDLNEGAIDFDKFLDGFFNDLFPELKQRPLHFAGESFGGQYLPVYASMARRRFASLILVNALVDFSDSTLGYFHHFCSESKADGPMSTRSFNETACLALAAGYSTCEKYGSLCGLTYDVELCQTAFDKCLPMMEAIYTQVFSGDLDPYDDRRKCQEPPICANMGMEQVQTYLNSTKVKQAVGLPEDFHFRPVNFDLNAHWAQRGQDFVPSTRQLVHLLDSKQTPILVMNGNNDVVVNTEGIIRTYDNLQWSNHALFRAKKYTPWYFEDDDGSTTLGGMKKTVGNLTVLTVDNAGHMSPQAQPIGVADVVAAWLRNSGSRERL